VPDLVEIICDAAPEDVRPLFREYADSLGFSLDFQDFECEIAHLAGVYAPPLGSLLLAARRRRRRRGAALRPLDATTCELKRLYVRPSTRRVGLGRLLPEAAIAEACARGYVRMRLDTVPGMEAARAPYRTLGFKEIAPYTRNRVSGTRFLELD
jgi:GNAT superfamily N-acetyltransferase